MPLFSILNRYFFREFLHKITVVTLAFFGLGIILNLFEEINFFKEFDVGVLLPLLMSLFKVPHLIYKLFPFIILIASIWFFFQFIRDDEMTAIKIGGISNAKIILSPCLIAFGVGVVFVLGLTPITSTLAQKYFNLKGGYVKNNDFLAAITVNGIWIKEKNQNNYSYIRSATLTGSKLTEVSIYQFDLENNPLMRIEAEEANIKNKMWSLKNVKIYKKDENLDIKKINEMQYLSAYDINSIKNLYSNLETVSFWNLKKLSSVYQKRGYSTKEIESKFHRAIAFPFFLLSMVFLAGVSIMGLRFRGKYVGYIFFAIVSSVIIYYFNDFSKALGETDKLPIQVAVWMPVLIIFVFSSIGLIHVNQK